jgi:phage terminase large subunit
VLNGRGTVARKDTVGLAITASQEIVEIGADIARYGGDESVAYVRVGAKVVAADYWRNNDTMQSAGRIANLARQWNPRAIKVDEIGVGAGVVDRLREEKFPVIGVNVGEAAIDKENYYNRRSELYAGLAQRFRDGEISLPGEDPILLAQLCALKKEFTPKGQMRLESKDDMRKRLPKMGSPDRAEALMLAFAKEGNRWLPAISLGTPREMG